MRTRRPIPVRSRPRAANPPRRVLHQRLAGIAATLGLAALTASCGSASTPGPSAPPAASPPAVVSPTPGEATPSVPVAIETIDDLGPILREIAAAEPSAARERVQALWSSLVATARVPLAGETGAVFLYRGEAEEVHWRGSFNGWGDPGLAGRRIGSTDLWVAVKDLPPASRVEYKIVVDRDEWLADPANPATGYNGLFGVTSVLALPGFEVSDVARDGGNPPAGRVEAGQSIASANLGYPVEYWVYTPPGYESLDRLPVVYLLDGNDFVDDRMGSMPAVLDALIESGRIPPLLAVFVDAREPGNPKVNRREEQFLARPAEHARFIADELVPAIDGAYRTDPDPDARAIAGVSFGGVSATYIAVAENDTFHRLAAFSPSLWVIDSPASLADEAKAAGAALMAEGLEVVTSCDASGAPCPSLRIFLSGGLPTWDVGELAGLAGVLAQRGYAVDFRSVLEGHTWDQWRGLSDEMLAFLFGTP